MCSFVTLTILILNLTSCRVPVRPYENPQQETDPYSKDPDTGDGNETVNPTSFREGSGFYRGCYEILGDLVDFNIFDTRAQVAENWELSFSDGA